MTLAVDLRFDLRNALLPLPEDVRIRACLRDAEVIAERLADEERLGRVYTYLTRSFWGGGQHREAISVGERALALAERLGAVGPRVATQFYLGIACHSIGDLQRAIALLGAVADLLGDAGARERFGLPYLPGVFARMWLGWCLAERGDFARGLAQALSALEIAESVGDPWDLMVASLGLGLARATQGRFAEAIAPLERADALGREHGIQTFKGLAAHYLGCAYLRAGRTDQGVELLETAAGLSPQLRSVNHSRVLTDLGEAYLVAGRVADAAVATARGLALARERGERLNEALALRLVAEIAANRETRDVGTAETRYRESLMFAEELGARPLAAHCHLGLGAVYAKIGKHVEARVQLTAAAHLYRAMEMAFWLPQAEAALAAVVE